MLALILITHCQCIFDCACNRRHLSDCACNQRHIIFWCSSAPALRSFLFHTIRKKLYDVGNLSKAVNDKGHMIKPACQCVICSENTVNMTIWPGNLRLRTEHYAQNLRILAKSGSFNKLSVLENLKYSQNGSQQETLTPSMQHFSHCTPTPSLNPLPCSRSRAPSRRLGSQPFPSLRSA